MCNRPGLLRKLLFCYEYTKILLFAVYVLFKTFRGIFWSCEVPSLISKSWSGNIFVCFHGQCISFRNILLFCATEAILSKVLRLSPVEEEDYVHNYVGFPQSKHLSPMIHLWFDSHVAHSCEKNQSTLCRKLWVFFRCSGFLPQAKLTEGVLGKNT